MSNYQKFWKLEKPNSAWHPVSDDPESIQGAISQGAMFLTWAAVNGPTGNGFEPLRRGPLVIDLDAEDFEKALQESLQIISYLEQVYGVDPNQLRIYLSGKKGLHLEIDQVILGATPGQYLPLEYKRIVSKIAADLGLETVDFSMYSQGKGKMFRLPNVQRSNGRYKVPVMLSELMGLDTNRLVDMTREPRELDQDEQPENPKLADMLNAEFLKARQQVADDLEQSKSVQPIQTAALGKLDSDPDCIAALLRCTHKTDRINFNKLCLNLAAYFTGRGYSLQETMPAVSAFLDNFQDSDTYKTRTDREKHFTGLFHYIQSNPAYSFSCGFIRGLGLPGGAFECSRCPLSKAYEPVSKAATSLADKIQEDIIKNCQIDPEDKATIDALAVNAQAIDAIIKSSFWSGQKSKMFSLNYNDFLNQYLNNDAFKFLCKTFGKVFDRDAVTAIIDSMELGETKAKKLKGHVNAIPKNHIIDYLKYHNQRDCIQWRVDMFAEKSHVELLEDEAKVVLPHKPFKTTGSFDHAVVEDFKDHFKRFDEFLTFIVASRFALDRKKSYLWILADSDWGKGFLLGIFKRMGISVETSMKEVEAMLEGKPSGKSPKDFKSAFVLAIDEFKTVKSELKQLQSEIALSPKNQLQCTVEVFAKIFFSAETVSSLVTESGVEDQFANRISIFQEKGSLLKRPYYRKVGNPKYFDSVLKYATGQINRLVEEMRSMGRVGSQTYADQWLDEFIRKYGLDTIYQRFSESLPALAKEVAAYWTSDNFAMNGKVIKSGGAYYIKSPSKLLDDYLRENFDQSQVYAFIKKKDEILRLMSEDGRGVSNYRVEGRQVKCLKLAGDDWL